MILYLVGPSGVGKSSACRLLRSSRPDITVIDVDEEFNRCSFDDWSVVGPWLSSLHNDRPVAAQLVVDIGAGYQHFLGQRLVRFLHEVQAFVVLITAPPEGVIARQPVKGRAMAEFVHTEYTSRRDLYACADSAIDVRGLGQEDAERKVVNALLGILGGSPLNDRP